MEVLAASTPSLVSQPCRFFHAAWENINSSHLSLPDNFHPGPVQCVATTYTHSRILLTACSRLSQGAISHTAAVGLISSISIPTMTDVYVLP
eukprot:scaffold107701_cov20-Prasinocladus_malaysianus.AAC.1